MKVRLERLAEVNPVISDGVVGCIEPTMQMIVSTAILLSLMLVSRTRAYPIARIIETILAG